MNKKMKKFSVALTATALATCMMVGTALAGVRISVAPAGCPSYKSKILPGITMIHQKNCSEAFRASKDAMVTIPSSEKFNGVHGAEWTREAARLGYSYAVPFAAEKGFYFGEIKRTEKPGTFGINVAVLGEPIVGTSYEHDGSVGDTQRISWIGKRKCVSYSIVRR